MCILRDFFYIFLEIGNLNNTGKIATTKFTMKGSVAMF